MLKHKNYMDIDNFNFDISKQFNKGDKIIIQEKIDGANASFQYDSDEDTLVCFSRRQTLTQYNTLRGFYEWVQNLDKSKVYKVLGDNLRIFGEWLVKHTVEYPEECYNNFYCFDVFDMEKSVYLPQNEVKAIAEKLGVKYVGVFFEGTFTKWDDYMHLVGKTDLGGKIGEGIVIKKIDTLANEIIYTKIVSEQFRETSRNKRTPKPVDMEAVHKHEHMKELTESIVTRARVEKSLHKMIDEGILPENYTEDDYKTIFKNLPSAVYYDCLKEEPQVVNQIENFGKFCGTTTTKIIKKILEEREN